MEVLELVKLGTPVLVLGMLLYLERINGTVNGIQDDVRRIREGIIWQDTCNARHEEINRRFQRLEQDPAEG